MSDTDRALEEGTDEEVAEEKEEEEEAKAEEQVLGREHTEAAILAFTTAYFNGVEWHLTMREGIEGEAVVKFLENIEAVTAWLNNRTGWSFQGTQIGRVEAVKAAALPVRTIQPVAPTVAAPIVPTIAPVAAAVQPASDAAAGDQLDVQQISSHVTDNGKEFFRVKGGRYMRHGVRVWPEIAATLETYGIVLADLEMGQAYDISKFGLVALFCRSAEGKISKVIQFVKKGG